jgi:hypothetical protein
MSDLSCIDEIYDYEQESQDSTQSALYDTKPRYICRKR